MSRRSASLALAAAALLLPLGLLPGVALADVVSGNVLDGSTLKPVANATISVAGTTITTDKVGGFRLDLAPGTTALDVTAAGYDAATDELIVPDGGITDYVVLLYKPGTALETVELEDDAPVPPPPGKQDMPREQITRIPGARGDALTAVRSLPGVGNAVGGGSGPGLVVIRGAAPEDSKITIDGIEVPVLYHFFGLQSVLPSEFIANIEFLPGGFGAEEGRSTGGVINVVTRAEAAPDTTGFAELSFINLAGFVQTPLSKRARPHADRRRPPLAHRLHLAGGASATAVNFTTAPQYYDGQLRVDWRRGEGDRVSVAGDDQLRSAVAHLQRLRSQRARVRRRLRQRDQLHQADRPVEQGLGQVDQPHRRRARHQRVPHRDRRRPLHQGAAATAPSCATTSPGRRAANSRSAPAASCATTRARSTSSSRSSRPRASRRRRTSRRCR
jgi:hypothetical protein